MIITFDQLRSDWIDLKKEVSSIRSIQEVSKDAWCAESCYTNSPQCVPARLSWITGLAPSQLGVTKNHGVKLPGYAPSYVREIRNKGWTTSIVGKTHWSDHLREHDLREEEHRIKELGFDNVLEVPGPRACQRVGCQMTDDWKTAGLYEEYLRDLDKRYRSGIPNNAWMVKKTVLPNDLYPDIWIANKAIENIYKIPSDKPWLLWISFVGPHEPFDTPMPWHGIHEKKKMPEAISRYEWINQLKKDNELSKTWSRWNKLHITKREISSCRRDYSDHLALLDKQVGRIMEALKKRDDIDRTAICMTSDHGDMLGDGGMMYKGTLLEPSIRVPFIYRPAEIQVRRKKGKVLESKALNLTDLIGWVIDMVDPKQLEYRKFLDLVRNNKYAVVEYGNDIAVIRNKRKVVVNDKGEILWAIDLRKDPKEMINIEQHISHNLFWRKLMNYATVEVAKRRQKNWVWEDLTK